jgi:Xaa-Pro aminopeptidase
VERKLSKLYLKCAPHLADLPTPKPGVHVPIVQDALSILGEPDAELVDLLGVIEEIHQQARRPIRRGAVGAEIFGAAHKTLDTSPHQAYLDFAAHGMGLISHEAPRLISDRSTPYEAYGATRPLEASMVISIETTMAHPQGIKPSREIEIADELE